MKCSGLWSPQETQERTPEEAAADERGIPRLIYLGRILWLCIFPLLTVIVGDLALLLVPQAKEALVAFDRGSGTGILNTTHLYSQEFSFEVAYVAWMVSAWYVARLLVGRRFKPDLVGVCCSEPFALRVTTYLPRILAVVAGLPVAVVLLLNKHLWPLGLVLIVSCALVFAILVFRRKVATRHGSEWVQRWKKRGRENVEHFDALACWARVFIASLFLVSFGLWLAIPIGLQHVARPVGAPALLLFALMSWTVFGGFILTYLPKSLGIPSLTWVAGVALFVFSYWNENHPVAPAVAGMQRLQPQAPLAAFFVSWQQRRADRSAPVIFVASAGGASRAAYWTTSALGKLEDEARDSSKAFADNIFVISGVSGGSLGAAAFVTTVDLTRRVAAKSPDCRRVRDTADSFTGRDHLASVVGMMLFPDLLQRFLPIPVSAWDRSRGLEEVWASDWDELRSRCADADPTPAGNPWTQAFTALYMSGSRANPLPALALNSTAIKAGQVVMQSNFTLARQDAFNLLASRFATRSLTLAQAVHNSARFPYISPVGVVRMADLPATSAGGKPQRGGIWDRLGDGGYVEASGALVLAQIIKELRDADLIRDVAAPGACASPGGAASDCFITEAQVRVLVLDNSPTNGNGYICWPTDPARESAARTNHAQNAVAEDSAPWPPGADFFGPLSGSFSTRGGRGVSAEVDLRALANGCNDQFAELRLPKPLSGTGAVQPSMNWMLDRDSREQIDLVLDTKEIPPDSCDGIPRQLLQQNLDLVRTWFSAPSGSGVTASAQPSHWGPLWREAPSQCPRAPRGTP